ncbi:MAG: hypothetical protein ACRDP6_36905 [Actinoallomurus sp.]
MPDGGGSDNEFAVDIDALENGGVRIKEIAGIVAEIHTNLESVHPEDGFDGGSDIEQALRSNYLPAARATGEFFRGLRDLVDVHGDNVVNFSALAHDVNDAASNEARGAGRRG